ncbi:MAG TPA: hypothetical protein VHC20_06595 [Candidatus Paceibacterota bacterium]|nr:hypothetical protein [Candidatus Paceibacterota bacterium]
MFEVKLIFRKLRASDRVGSSDWFGERKAREKSFGLKASLCMKLLGIVRFFAGAAGLNYL